jgi:type III pantothenate kinase
LANAVGAARIFPGKNCLVIDAGTCIKYDFVNAKGEYLGGAISPGITMRYQALHAFTAQLPLVKAQPHVKLTGNSTASAIVSGVQNGALSEIEHVILQYKKQYKPLKIVVTGGDWGLFANQIKSHIFAAPDLTLMGLNQILENNK